MPSVAFGCASAFAWHSRSSRATASASALPVLVPRPPAFALSGRRDVHPHVRPRARSWAPLHSPCLSTSALNYNISYKFSTATGVDIGKHMSGFWLEQAFAPDKATPQAKLVEPGWVWFPGSSDKGLQHTWDQMKKMMATPKFSSAATPRFRGDFVVEKVSQDDAAFILAWLSDPSASKRAHSTVDLTADGLDFGTKTR